MRLIDNETYRSQLDDVLTTLDLSPLQGKTVLVTGALGMLGSCLLDLLRHLEGTRVIALGRDAVAAENRFGPPAHNYFFHQQDVCDPIEPIQGSIDYIIHAASNSNPVRYAQDPVGTLMANVQGAKNLLDFGRAHKMKRFLYVSSGEVYGQPNESCADFTEDYCGPIDLSSPRSCYPEGKRAAEVLCQSYLLQYGVDSVIVRPCHLFGPTMTRRDSRAVSEFLWNAVDRQNIVMKSAGLLERSHCYVMDSAKAILLVLLKGKRGQAYNIADRRYQMRVGEFAQRVAQAGGCQVVYEKPTELERMGFSRTTRAVLDASKLERLGWVPTQRSFIQETVDILRGIQNEK